MFLKSLSLVSAAALAAVLAASAPAGALTMQECSAKYQSAKSAGTLKGMKWNDFRKAECSDDDASEADAAAAEKEAEKPAASPASKPAIDKTASDKTAAPKAPSAKPAAGGKASFPSDVSPKYASETPGKARMHTCLDQYRANKEAGVEQPKWIEKGGGYYSQCNTRLKNGA